MEAVELQLRHIAGLPQNKNIHPAPEKFRRLADAIAFRQRLTQEGHYSSEQVGVLARDVDHRGAKVFMVDTYAGFARAVSPRTTLTDDSL